MESLIEKLSIHGDNPNLLNAECLVRVKEEDDTYRDIKGKFLSGMREFRDHTSIVSIHEITHSAARFCCHQIYLGGMETNVRLAWYGTSKVGIEEIIDYGFSDLRVFENDGVYGLGIYLSPLDLSLESIKSSVDDENGSRHVLLCEVILGNMEEVRPPSNQRYPSSRSFDTGVDSLLSPTKHIVWSTMMNTHILPKWVVSCTSNLFPGTQGPANGSPLVTQKPVEAPPCSVVQFPKGNPKGAKL